MVGSFIFIRMRTEPTWHRDDGEAEDRSQSGARDRWRLAVTTMPHGMPNGIMSDSYNRPPVLIRGSTTRVASSPIFKLNGRVPPPSVRRDHGVSLGMTSHHHHHHHHYRP